MEQLSNVQGNLKNAVGNASNAFSDGASFIKDKISTSSIQVMILSLVVLATIGFLVVYLVRKLATNYVNQISYSVPATKEGKIVLNAETATSSAAAGIPNMSANGQRASFSFWVYLHDVSDIQVGSVQQPYRFVMRRAGPNNFGAGPVVFMGGATDRPNRMFVYIPKNNLNNNVNLMTPAGPSTSHYKLDENSDPVVISTEDSVNGGVKLFTAAGVDQKLVSACQGITIPYVPIQRWVHIAVVVNELVNGGTITAYVDAEQVMQITNAGTNFNLNDRNEFKFGATGVNGVNGLLSYFTFFNYDLNTLDVYNDYRKGPIRSLVSKLGIPYGIQSPIYRLSE